MTKVYSKFISAIAEENYAEANKYLRLIVDAKMKKKIKKVVAKLTE